MFETLHTIDWSHVESCYGTSEEIPAAIRGLVSAEASVRDRARGTLWMSLEHQGSVYEASALTVPFLLAILADPQTQDKGQLVHFLAHLGCRGLYLGHWYENLQTRLVYYATTTRSSLFMQRRNLASRINMQSQSMSNERKPNLFKAHSCLMGQHIPSELLCGW